MALKYKFKNIPALVSTTHRKPEYLEMRSIIVSTVLIMLTSADEQKRVIGNKSVT